MKTSLPHIKKIYSSSEKISAPIIKTFLSLIVACVIIAFSPENASAQLTNGLVALYTFDNLTDQTGNNPDLQLLNGAALDVGIHKLPYAQSTLGANLSGNSHLEIPQANQLNFGNGSFSFAGWVRKHIHQNGVTIMGSSLSGTGWRLKPLTNGNWSFFYDTDTQSPQQIGVGGGPIDHWVRGGSNSNKWVFVCLTVNTNTGIVQGYAGQSTINADGSPNGSPSLVTEAPYSFIPGGSVDTSSPFYISHGGMSASWDQLGFWNRVLTPAEVSQLYNNGNPLFIALPPPTPGTITQPALACAGSTGNLFSIAPVSGATSYNWSVTGTGWAVTAGGTTTTATITIGSGPGTVSVQAVNGSGSSAASTTGTITVQSALSAPAGSYFDITTCSILPCPAGSFCAGGASQPVLCPAGFYSASAGQQVCTPCEAGKFNPNEGATSCTDCPAGKFSSFQGATECQLCLAGTFSSAPGAVTCNACPVGQGSPPGASACTACTMTCTATGTDPTCPNLNNGTVSTTVSGGTGPYSYSWSSGTACNNALDFDGSNDYVERSPLLLSTNDFTIEFWVKANTLGGFPVLFAQDISGQPNPAFRLELRNATNFLRFVMGDGLNQVDIYSTLALTTATWTHIAVVRSGNNYTIYINGVSNSSSSSIGSIDQSTNTIPFTIGARINSALNMAAEPFNGTFDEFRIWNVARTPAEILADMNNELSAQANLVMLYHFNEGVAGGTNTGITTATDAAGSNDGTLNNFTLTGTTSNWVSGAPPLNSSICDLTAGVYSVTVTDANGCSTTCTATLTNPTVSFTLTGTDPKCVGASDGTATIPLTSIVIPSAHFHTTWSPNASTANDALTATGLAADTYTVTVSDLPGGAGCSTSRVITLVDPPALSCTASSTNPLCNGGNTGTAIVTASGGSPVIVTIPGFNFLGASKDNTMYAENSSISNGAGPAMFAGTDAFSNVRRALLAFDLSSIPSGATITSATLRLNHNQTNTVFHNPHNIALHKVTNDWGEGSESDGTINSGGENGASATTVTATWTDNFFNTSSWTTPGGDYNSPASSTTLVTGAGFYNWTSATVIADVQDWLDNPVNNFGWILIGDEANPQTAKRFNTREAFGSGLEPQLQLTYTVPVSTYTYLWDNNASNQTTQTATGLTAGVYSVTVTDANNCQATCTVTLSDPPALTCTATGTDPTCPNLNNGTVSTTVSGGTGPYSYSWSSGTTCNNALDFDGVDDHVVTTLQDDPNSSWTFSAWINPTSFPSNGISALGNTVVAADLSSQWGNGFGINSSQIKVIYNNGWTTFPYVFNVNTWYHVAVVTDITAGNITAYVNGILVATNAVTFTTGGSVTVFKIGHNPGVSSNPFAGMIDEVRIWNVARTGPEILANMNSELSAQANLVALYHLNEGVAGAFNGGVTTATDASGNGNNGTLNGPFNLFGTTSNWVNGAPSIIASGSNICDLTAGVYSVTVTDANGCSTTCTATLTNPTVSFDLTGTDPKCVGASDGTATISNIVIPSAHFHTTWSPNASTANDALTATGLSAGTYTVTVSDLPGGAGCSTSRQVTLSDPPALSCTATGTDPLCHGGNDGSATVNIPGSLNQCFLGQTGSQNAGTQLGSSRSLGQNFTACQSGFISQILVRGSFNNQNGDQIALHIAAGINTITPTYIELLTQPSPGNSPWFIDLATPFPVVSGNTYAFTLGGSGSGTTGSMITSLRTDNPYSGGNFIIDQVQVSSWDMYFRVTIVPFSVSWNTSPVQNTATASGLSAGTYTVTVTDANGCTTSCTATLSNPPALSCTATGTNPLCHGGNTGTASAAVSGGTAPYSYTWSAGTPCANALSFDGVNDFVIAPVDVIPTSGEYTVSVWAKQVDNHPGTYRELFSQGNNIYLGQSTTGDIRVGDSWISTGVTFPTDNQWHHYAVVRKSTDTELYIDGVLALAKGSSIPSPVPGSNLHIGAQYGIIGEYFDGHIDEVRVWNVARTPAEILTDMNNELSAQANLVALYHLNEGVAGANNTGITTATDASGNGNNGTLNGPFALTGTTSNWVSGAPSIIASGSNICDLAAGTYTVTVTDANNCAATCTVTLSDPPALTCTATGTDPLCHGGNTGTASAAVSGGTAPYTYAWSSGTTCNNALDFDGANDYVSIGNPSSLDFERTDAFSIEAWVKYSGTGSQMIYSKMNNVGIPFRGYEFWSNGGDVSVYFINTWNSNTIYVRSGTLPLADGQWHHVAMTYSGNSNASGVNMYVDGVLQSKITVYNSLSASIQTTAPAQLGARSPGAFYWNGTLDEVRVWDTERTQAEILATMNTEIGPQTNLVALYHLNEGVAGANNAGITIASDASGNGNNGTLNGPFALTGTTSNWVSGAPSIIASGSNICDLTAGTYTVTVTDINNCAATCTVTLSNPPALTCTVAGVNPCHGTSTGSATVTVSNGTGTINYQWSANASSQITPTATGLAAGTYTVTVTDDCGSTTCDVILKDQPAIPALTPPAAQTTCSGIGVTLDVISPFPVSALGNAFKWSRGNTTNVSGTVSATSVAFGTGALNTGALVNNTSSNQTVTYTLTPYSFGANNVDEGCSGDDCAGTPVTVDVTVKAILDCQVSAWSAFSAWSACSNNLQSRTRTRTIAVFPQCGGNPCPPLSETETQACPNTITLSSGADTDVQNICFNSSMTDITYATTDATGATFAGLPAGVNGSWAADVVTITGTPTVTGLFNYTITLTGGDGTGSASGTITVTAVPCSQFPWDGN